MPSNSKHFLLPVAVVAVLTSGTAASVLKARKKLNNFEMPPPVASSTTNITNYTCNGEYEQCPDTGECVMIAADCGKCGANGFGLYLCPDRNSCVADAADCPAIAGTFWDWTLSTNDRVSLILQQLDETEMIQQLQNSAPAIPHLNIPAFQWLVDNVHGVNRPRATSFPSGVTLGNTWSHRYLSRMAEVMTIEARALHRYNIQRGNRAVNPETNGQGITFYGPNLNLVRDPRWGRNQEVYSEDPFLTGRLTQVVVRMVQSRIPNAQPGKKPQGGTNPAPSDYSIKSALACCKHFAVYNVEDFPVPRHQYDAVVGARDMWETYLPHFEMCASAKKKTPDSHGDIWDPAAHSMCSYNRINGVPACGNEDLLNGVLRSRFGFEGFVVSDYDAWDEIYSSQKYCPNITCAAATGLNAGCDQEGGGHTAIDALSDAISLGMTTSAKVETAARRLFTARVELGVFDPPTLAPSVTAVPFSQICSDQHLRTALSAAEAGIVLLKNRLTSDTFTKIKAKHRTISKSRKWSPNKKNFLDNTVQQTRSATAASKIAVIGPTASATTWLQGNYDKPPAWGVISILEGLYHGACKEMNEGTELLGQQVVGIDLRGGEASDTNVSAPAATIEECITKCEADLSCNYYTFDATQKRCYYLRDTMTQIAAPSTVISGSRGGLAVMNYGYSIAKFGTDTPSFPPPIDERECSIRCLADPGCKFFVFTASSLVNLCYLRPSGQKMADPNSVWGASPNKCQDANTKTPLDIVSYTPACLDSLACGIPQQSSDGVLFSDAIEAAASSDFVVVVGGLDQSMERESHDRQTIDLPANQSAYFDVIAKQFSTAKPLVAVFVHGGTFILPESTKLDAQEGKDFDAVFTAGYPSQMGGMAFSNLLFRKKSPSGKTATSWYKSNNDLPFDLSHESFYPNSSVPNANGYTYRYFKPETAPNDRFAVDFGFGLSYTTFQFSVSDTSPISINPCDTVSITVQVKNTGNMTGSAVAQLYTNKPTGDTVSKYPMPLLRLVDFFRFEDILPGYTVSKQLSIEPLFMTTVIDDNDPRVNPDIYKGTRFVFPGQFDAFIGPSQPTTKGWEEAGGIRIPIVIKGTDGVNYDTACKRQ